MFAWGISTPDFTLLLLAVLLFGKKLPEVAASMGKTFRVFQQSWHGIEDDTIDRVTRVPPPVRQATAPARITTSVPPFAGATAAPDQQPAT
jgi:Sec-independent protein translocase protein TatA